MVKKNYFVLFMFSVRAMYVNSFCCKEMEMVMNKY